jgi:hypothetical protein
MLARAITMTALVLDATGALAAERAARAVVVPLTLVEGQAIVVAYAGTATLRVLVDTGGFGGLGVKPEALAALPVRYASDAASRTDGSGRTWRGRTFVVPDLAIGGAHFHDVAGYERTEANEGTFGGSNVADAVLGRDFLREHVVVVDYPQRRLELHPRDAGARVCRGRGRTTLFTVDNGFWASEVVTDRGSLTLVWDTGARDASFVRTNVAQDLQWPARNGVHVTQRFSIGELDAGPVAFAPVTLNGRLAADGMIGGPVFQRHRVCFDPANRVVTVD